MEIKDCERKILEKHFSMYEDNISYQLEDWTSGGVDMLIDIDKDSNDSLIEQLKKYIENFDIDEEIDLYRESENYRDHFTIRESLKDFEDWLEYIMNIIKELEG